MSEGDDESSRFDVPTNTLRVWIIVGTVAQVAMVVAGHWVAFINNGFAIGGMLISAVAAALFARAARLPRGQSAWWGAVVGGVCALIGIVVSVELGDSPAILVVGTLSSGVTGAIGGAIAGGKR